MMKSESDDALPSTTEEMGVRVIALLLVIEAISVFLLWSLNSFTPQGQNAFALYLGVDFVAFAMMSYLYRTLENDGRISRIVITAGCCFIAALFLISLTQSG